MSQDIATRRQVHVLVVDDSAFMRTALSRMIASESGFEVIATACSGSDALEKIASLDPDVVTLDIEMPGLNGLQTLRCIMNQFPRPVIMVSAVTEEGAEQTFDALAAGAFDYVPKKLSSTSLDIQHIRQDLVAKIRTAAQSRKSGPCDVFSRKPPQSSLLETWDTVSTIAPAIVALGTSTGGPKALQEILPLFPRDFSVPILIVQHMPPGFAGPFAQRMNALCSVTVREATHGEPIQPGVVYIAPAGMHMTVGRPSDSRAIICLDTHPLHPHSEDRLHVPSVDVLMKSVAEAFRSLALGVILTGMGSDGAEGMKAIHRLGGLTIGQDEASCTVYSMPRACAELGVLSRVVSLSDIPGQILQATQYRRRA
ncbi:MAG: chemotaxis response regulator protein-glutamate methylesterase [Candidatus Sulfotelmatobacter sp.]